MNGCLTNKPEYKSKLVLSTQDGIQKAATRNLNKQKSVLENTERFDALLQKMPPYEWPASGGVESCLKTIKSLLNLHRGELREWEGHWEPVYPVDAVLPEGVYHDQFYPPHGYEEYAGAISTVLSKRTSPASGGKPAYKPAGKPASGGEWGGGHSVRVAIVFGLADLFYDYGEAASAGVLYNLYTELRVFAHRRVNTKPKSRQGHWKQAHWKR